MPQPKQASYALHLKGWENDPLEERFKLSTLDYLSAQTYNNYALYFTLPDREKPNALKVLREGLRYALADARHLCGTVERDPNGGHSFVKWKDSAVPLIVQYLDGPYNYVPSFDELAETHFATSKLGDVRLISVDRMMYGEKPEASPDASPPVAAFQANFIHGGMIFNMHSHHYANDVMGWAGFVHQLAEHCAAIINGTEHPTWAPGCLDTSRLRPIYPIERQIDGPTPPDRHPDHRPCQSLLFHLPKSKAAELKKLATPAEGWISTYDAFSAFIWRTLTRIRAKHLGTDPSALIQWGEAVNMRSRLHDPPVPKRIQTNVMFAALSMTAPVKPLPCAEVTHTAPLSLLATYIRALTNSVTQEDLIATLGAVAPVKDKTSLFTRVNSFAPGFILMTDWRETDICGADFGFGKPRAFRHLFEADQITEGLVIVYPPRTDTDEDKGCEFAVSFEKEWVKELIEDKDFAMFFEYRGVDAG